MTEAPRKTWARHASRWVPVLLVAAGCVYLARTVDVAQLKASLLTVDVWPLALSVLFAALGVVAHSAYWRVLLRTVAPVTLREMVIYSFASYATNVFPMRPGEALRVWLVQKRHGVPVVFGAATIALEKIADVLSLLILVSPLPWLIADLPPSVAKALRILPCIVVAAIVAVVIASRHALRWNVLSGFRVVHRPGVIAAGFACIFLAWLCDVSAVLSTLVAVHIAPTIEKALLVILSVNIAVAIPATPGQVGVHEAGSIAALRLVGVSEVQAIPFALLYHVTQLLPVLVLGMASLRFLSRSGEPLPTSPPKEDPPAATVA